MGTVFLRGEIQHKNLWLMDLKTGAEPQLTTSYRLRRAPESGKIAKVSQRVGSVSFEEARTDVKKKEERKSPTLPLC